VEQDVAESVAVDLPESCGNHTTGAMDRRDTLALRRPRRTEVRAEHDRDAHATIRGWISDTNRHLRHVAVALDAVNVGCTPQRATPERTAESRSPLQHVDLQYLIILIPE
jgi:hypothetical protein